MSNTIKSWFGIKYAIPYNKVTLEPYGVLKVIGGMELTNDIEMIKLQGGHSSGAYKTEAGEPEVALTGTIREFPDFVYGLIESADVTVTTGESTGYIGTVENTSGTSVFDATTGIATVTAIADSEAKIPFGRVIFKAASTTTVDVYVVGDASEVGLQTDGIVASGVVVPGTGGTIDIPEIGLTLTGGSGTVLFVVDDVAAVDTRPTNTEASVISVGADLNINEFGMLIVQPKQSDGSQFIFDVPRCAGVGLGFMSNSREYGEKELNLTVMTQYNEDTQKDELYTITRIER